METPLVSKASSTMIYTLLLGLRREIVNIYRKACRVNRAIVVTPVHTLVNSMIGDYCYAYETTDKKARVERLERVKSNYYIVESSLVEMYEEKAISGGYLANLVKSCFEPLYANLSKYYNYAADVAHKEADAVHKEAEKVEEE